MKILHSKVTEQHNNDSEFDGRYRVQNFSETITAEQIEAVRPLAEQYVGLVHSPRYVRKIQNACRLKSELAEVALTPASFEAMMTSAALAVLAAQTSSFAVTRPPGHHASHKKAEGFCFFNNVAVAVTYLLHTGAERVCVVDIDGHHGNGTQALFCDEGRVLFCSVHQEGTYPQTGRASDIGRGASFQKVTNIPLPAGAGDDVFLRALEFFAERIALFDPHYIAVSAGFDGYSQDRLLQLKYSKQGYCEAGRLLARLDRPIFAVLEGGYHTEIKACVDAFTTGTSERSFETGEQLSVSSPECQQYISETLQTISETFAKS